MSDQKSKSVSVFSSGGLSKIDEMIDGMNENDKSALVKSVIEKRLDLEARMTVADYKDSRSRQGIQDHLDAARTLDQSGSSRSRIKSTIETGSGSIEIETKSKSVWGKIFG